MIKMPNSCTYKVHHFLSVTNNSHVVIATFFKSPVQI